MQETRKFEKYNIPFQIGEKKYEYMQEKRKFERYDIPLYIKFRKLSSRGYHSGVTCNFSREGLCFESGGVALESQKKFELSVKHPQDNKFFPVKGNIVWSRRVGTKCLVGIKLKEMDKEARQDILDYAYDICLP